MAGFTNKGKYRAAGALFRGESLPTNFYVALVTSAVAPSQDLNTKGQFKDMVWTASGGTLPGSGDGARYAVLTDDNVTQDDREVWCYWDLSSDRVVSDTQTLTLSDLELRFTESQ